MTKDTPTPSTAASSSSSSSSTATATEDTTAVAPLPSVVVVHPLVLLAAVDLYGRLALNSSRRVVGVLLGEHRGRRVEVTNCFAVPFEEDDKETNVFFLDRDYCEQFYLMFKKVNAREQIIGWYSSGPRVRSNDLNIHHMFRKYTTHPVYVIIDVKQTDSGNEVPSKAYFAVEELEPGTSEPKMVFRHVPSEIGAVEPEEIGVEHLLRDVKDTNVSSLATKVQEKMTSLSGLESRIHHIQKYLQLVLEKKLPPNEQILGILQDILNIMPNMNERQLQQSVTVQMNDMNLAIFTGALTRALISLHNLINNKLILRAEEKQQQSDDDSEKTKKDAKDKDAKDKEKEKEKESKNEKSEAKK